MRRSFEDLAVDFRDVVAYQRGSGDGYHQFEVQLLENKADYLHICVSIDDGGFAKFIAPMTRSFIVHKDGRVEI